MKEVKKQKREEEIFRRGELPGRFIVKKLFGQSDKQYNQEYWGKLEWNQRQWKEEQARRERILETIKKEEEINQKKSKIRK